MPPRFHRHLTNTGVEVIVSIVIALVGFAACTLIFNGGFVQ